MGENQTYFSYGNVVKKMNRTREVKTNVRKFLYTRMHTHIQLYMWNRFKNSKTDSGDLKKNIYTNISIIVFLS